MGENKSLHIVRVDIVDVEPWWRNPRSVKPEEFERLKKQIQKLGVYKPLVGFRVTATLRKVTDVVDRHSRYVVLGGNMRLRALRELGVKTVEISLVEPKSEAQMFEYALSDNDQVGFYEDFKLAPLIDVFKGEIDLDAFKVAFDEPINLDDALVDFERKLAARVKDVEIRVDDSPARTRRGDVYQLGVHRIMCGDSTSSRDVAHLMGEKRFTLHFTSPPYWNHREYSHWEKYEDYLKDMRSVMKNVYDFSGSTSVCLWNIAPAIEEAKDMPSDHSRLLREVGFTFRGTIAWNKMRFMQTMRPIHILKSHLYYPMFVWEPIFIYMKNRYPRFERRDATYVDEHFKDLWEIPSGASEEGSVRGYLTPFPLELAERVIRCFSEDNTVVGDMFLGSGTTLIAAEKHGRVCYGMEINPKFCDVVVQRYCRVTGTSEESIRKSVRRRRCKKSKS